MHQLGPITLEGTHIRLEPLRLSHAEGIWAAGHFPEIWQWLGASITTPADARSFIERALGDEAAGKEHPFAVIRRETGEIVGSTRYLDVDPANKGVEIGWTWYTPAVWGTIVNPEAKLLLFRHAFEDWGARRVMLKTDHMNLHSQSAMRKLGAQYEGTLRNHRIRKDGTMRHTIVFSVIDTEWPTVKAGLTARIRG